MTDHPAEIQKLLQDLNDLLPELDAETRGIQLYGAPGLNVFSMFQPDERRVARILADLLDPKGRHGQGDLFLSAFLFAVGLPSLRRNDRVSVVVDEVTSEGRLVDITVNTSNSLLGIEVKLFSGQQKNQLQDYANHLKNNAVGRPMALVFLADQVPDTARNEVIRMPWAKPMMDDEGGRQTSPLSNILKKTLPRVRATRTRTFMDDFLIWIDNEFGGSSMNNSEFRPYVDAVVENLKDKNKHRSLAIFMLAQSKLTDWVINSIGAAVLDGLRNAFPKAENNFVAVGEEDAACLSRNAEWLLRRPHWPSNLQLGLTSEGCKCRGFGIKAPDAHVRQEHAVANDLREALDAQFEKIQRPAKTHHWPWYSRIHGRWDAQFAGRVLFEAPDGVIAKHREIEDMVNTLIKLAKIVDEVVDNLDINKESSCDP